MGVRIFRIFTVSKNILNGTKLRQQTNLYLVTYAKNLHNLVIYESRHEKACLRGLQPGKTQTGVPVYLAPWTACPPGGKPTAVGLPPRGQAVPGYLTPHPGYLNPRGASCPGRFILPPAHIKKILLCDVYYYLQHYNNYMQFLSCNYVNLNDYFKHSVGFLIDKGWGASCPGRFILPPT